MKTSFPRFNTLLLSALLIAPAFAQTAARTGGKEGVAPSEVTWTRGETRELANLRVELEVVRQRDGGAGVPELQHRIDAVEKLQPWLLSFDFSGGSLKKLLSVIGKASDVSLSIISSDPSGLDAQLPPFALHNASLQTIVSVLTQLLDPRGYNLKFAGDPSQANSVVCVLTKVAEPQRPNEVYPIQFASFPIGAYLNDQSVDDIVGAIRAGWELNPAHDKDVLRLKFHQPTAILLVSGPAEATSMAGKIISQLRGAFDKDSRSNLKARDQTPPPDKK